jgi:hypothetical protein
LPLKTGCCQDKIQELPGRPYKSPPLFILVSPGGFSHQHQLSSSIALTKDNLFGLLP